MKRGARQGGLPVSIELNFEFRLNGLPAPVATASASAITAIPATAASATAATTPATAASAATSTAAITATSASASTAASATLTRGASFVNDNIAAQEIMSVQALNGALGFLVAIDLDKPEPARLPRKTVAHQGNVRRGDSRLRK